MQIEDVRARCLRGETLTLDEQRALLASVRRGYQSIQTTPTKSGAVKRGKAKTDDNAAAALFDAL